MNKREIEERGYKWFPAPSIKEYISNNWQKRFRDEEGNTLYFITIYEYTFNIRGEVSVGYEAEIQLYQKETRNALNLQFLDGWYLEDIEQMAEKIYTSGLFVPYDY